MTEAAPAPSRLSTRTGDVHTFTCARCGQDAATIELIAPNLPIAMGPGPTGEPMSFRLSDSTPYTRLTWLGVSAAQATDEVARMLTEDAEIDPFVLGSINRDLGMFCCNRCALNYCVNCWKTWAVYNTDGYARVDEIRGICPEGHEQRLES
jgi:hypothetical protein